MMHGKSGPFKILLQIEDLRFRLWGTYMSLTVVCVISPWGRSPPRPRRYLAIVLSVHVAMSIEPAMLLERHLQSQGHTRLRDVLRPPANRFRLRAVPIRMRALRDHSRHP